MWYVFYSKVIIVFEINILSIPTRGVKSLICRMSWNLHILGHECQSVNSFQIRLASLALRHECQSVDKLHSAVNLISEWRFISDQWWSSVKIIIEDHQWRLSVKIISEDHQWRSSVKIISEDHQSWSSVQQD